MIRQLRIKLIAAAMVSLLLVLTVILGGVNFVSYRKMVTEADAILELLAENRGAFPPFRGREREPRHFSPETPFESRFFTVHLNPEGSPAAAQTANIAAVDEAAALQLAQQGLDSGRSRGFVGQYRFLVNQSAPFSTVIFLDCGRSISAFRTTLVSSILIALMGMVLVLLLLIAASGRIVKPVAESYEKQRQFITDAGHEIKTPLTIIQADADLLELDCGSNEWLADIRKQAERLSGLTRDLISLSRMDEERPSVPFVEFPLTDVVEETALSFQAPAMQQGKTLTVQLEPMLSLTGSEQGIRQLTAILLDNAIKYSPTDSKIQLELRKEAKNVILRVTNETSEPLEQDKLNRMFDRFYRMDASRNSTTGGYGLGLAIAKSIVGSHRGKIKAEKTEDKKLTITAYLPN